MIADARFAGKPQGFWGIIKLMSQELGYASKGTVRTYEADREDEDRGILYKLHKHIDTEDPEGKWNNCV